MDVKASKGSLGRKALSVLMAVVLALGLAPSVPLFGQQAWAASGTVIYNDAPPANDPQMEAMGIASLFENVTITLDGAQVVSKTPDDNSSFEYTVVLDPATPADAQLDLQVESSGSSAAAAVFGSLMGGVAVSITTAVEGDGPVRLQDGRATAVVKATPTLEVAGQSDSGAPSTWTINIEVEGASGSDELEKTDEVIYNVAKPSWNSMYVQKATITLKDVAIKSKTPDDLTSNSYEIVLDANTPLDDTFSIEGSGQSLASSYAVLFDGAGEVQLSNGQAQRDITISAVRVRDNRLYGNTNTVSLDIYVDGTRVYYPINLPEDDAFSVEPASGSTSPVVGGRSYSFTVALASDYRKGSNFAVKANGVELVPDASGVYTIADIQEEQTVTVEGVVPNTAPTLAEGVESSATDTALQYTNYNVNLADVFSDVDGDALTYTVSVDGGTPVAASETYQFKSRDANDHTLVFTASDGTDSSPTYTLTLSVQPVSMAFIHEARPAGSTVYPVVTIMAKQVDVAKKLPAAPNATSYDVVLDPSTAPDATFLVDVEHGTLASNRTLTWNDTYPVYVTLENGQATKTVSSELRLGNNTYPFECVLNFRVADQGFSNTAPVFADGVGAAASDTGMRYVPYAVDLNQVFSDADNDELAYFVSVDGAAEEFVADGSTYTYTSSAEGTHTFAFRAYDGAEYSPVHTRTVEFAPAEQAIIHNYHWGYSSVVSSSRIDLIGPKINTKTPNDARSSDYEIILDAATPLDADMYFRLYPSTVYPTDTLEAEGEGWVKLAEGQAEHTVTFVCSDERVGTRPVHMDIWVDGAVTYNMALPEDSGFSVTPVDGYTTTVNKASDFKFTVDLAEGYKKTNSFAVKANGVVLTPDANGIYTLSDVREDKEITVEGVVTEDTVIECTVTAANDTFAIVPAEGYGATALENEDYKFTIVPDEERGYRMTDATVVTANDVVLTPDENGVYTISSVPVNQVVAATLVHDVVVTAPAGSTIDAGVQEGYYKYVFIDPVEVRTLSDGRVQNVYEAGTSCNFWRVRNPNGVTYWDFQLGGRRPNRGRFIDSDAFVVTEDDLRIGDASFTKDTVRRFEGNRYDRADIYLTINKQGYLNMSTGQTLETNCFRNWYMIESIMNNQVALPDMHYQVIGFDGNPSDVVSVEAAGKNSCVATITANHAGTAVVLVTYDATIHKQGYNGNTDYSAIWPECTGVFVVSVDEDGSAIATNMELNAEGNALDAEHDTLYYLGDEGASYSFTPEEGTNVSVARCTVDDALTYSGFSTDGVSVEENGEVTVTGLTTGRHIVKVEKDGLANYQVVTARQTTLEIKDADGNVVEEGHAFAPGETVTLQFSNLLSPSEKLSGIYNHFFQVGAYGEDDAENPVLGFNAGPYGYYTFSSSKGLQSFKVTIPADWDAETYSVTRGFIRSQGFGDAPGAHRNLTYAIGRDPNLDADTGLADKGHLPDVVLNVALPECEHEWGEPEYTWADDDLTCTAKRTCSVCGDSETETAPSSTSFAALPTFESNGRMQIVATFTNAAFETQVKEGTETPKLAFTVTAGDQVISSDSDLVSIDPEGYDASYTDWQSGEKVESRIPLATVKVPYGTQSASIALNDAFESYQTYVYDVAKGEDGFVDYGFGNEVAEYTVVATAGESYDADILPQGQVYRVQSTYDEAYNSYNLYAIAFEFADPEPVEVVHVGNPLWVAGKSADIVATIANPIPGEKVTSWYWEYSKDGKTNWKKTGAKVFVEDDVTCSLFIPECTEARKPNMSWRVTVETSEGRTGTSAGQMLEVLQALEVVAADTYKWVKDAPVELKAVAKGLATGETIESVTWYYSKDQTNWKKTGAKWAIVDDGTATTLSGFTATEARKAPMAWSVRVTTSTGRTATSEGISLVE